MVIELRESFTIYGPNKRRIFNWVVNYLRIADFYDTYDETNGPLIAKPLFFLAVESCEFRHPLSLLSLYEGIWLHIETLEFLTLWSCQINWLKSSFRNKCIHMEVKIPHLAQILSYCNLSPGLGLITAA